MAKKAATKQEEPIEKLLRKAVNKLQNNMDAAEYKNVVLGQITLKYISDEYRAAGIFWVPNGASWLYFEANAQRNDRSALRSAPV